MEKLTFSYYKELSNLFNEVNIELDGDRYFSKCETMENKKCFIYAIIYKNYDTILSYLENLKDCRPCNDRLVRNLQNVVYKLT